MCGTSASSVAPGDALRRRGGLDGGGVVAVEVVPGPGEEGVGLAVRAAEQHRVHAEPGGERDRSLDLVPVLADLGDRRVAADHRHDALVLVVEGLRSARRAARAGCSPRPRRPDCWATEPSWGSVVPSPSGMLATSPTAYTPGKPVDGEVGLHVDPSAAAGRQARRPAAIAAADSPPPQTTVLVRMVGAVVELDPVGVHGGDAGLEPDLGPVLGQLACARSRGTCRRTRRAARRRGRPG